jgi:3-oxoadipate enol-lactonase
MGAIVGQAALIAAPGRIGRAVLANTAAKLGTPDIWNARILAAREEGPEAMAGAVAARWFTPEFREADPEAVEAVLFILRETSPQGYAAASAALRDFDQREAIRSIRKKVLVIVGRHDPSAPPELGASVASAIDGARLVTLESSHISPIEQTDAFAEAVIDFLTAPEAPARRPAAARKAAGRRARARITHRAPIKAPAKKAPAKKTAAKKAQRKKTPAKTMVAKQGAPKKARVAKTSAKKTARKTPVKKSAAKKALVAGKRAATKSPIKSAAKSKPVGTRKPAAKAAAGSAGKKAPSKGKAARKPPRRR